MQIVNSPEELELEKKFSPIRASFIKRFMVTFLDLLYVIMFNLPIFILASYWKPNADLVLVFKSFIKQNQTIEPWRLLCFSAWIFIFCYIYFVLVPSFTNYQTLFSNNLGLRAINLNKDLNLTKKVRQRQLFMANFVPIFLLLFLNIIFFATVSITNPDDWIKEMFSKDPDSKPYTKYIKIIMRNFFMIVAFLQICHLFTVSASRKTINWFVKSNGLLYVDAEKFDLLMASELKPLLTKNVEYVDMPGVNTMSYESVRESEQSTEEIVKDDSQIKTEVN